MKIPKVLLASMLITSVVSGQEPSDTVLIKEPRIRKCGLKVSGIIFNPLDTTLIVPESKDSSVTIPKSYKPCVACGRG